MTVYALVCRGWYRLFSGRGTILHGRAYPSREAAERAAPAFRVRCVTPGSPVPEGARWAAHASEDLIEDPSTVVSVVELELAP